jgi:hypothetical protein
MAGTVSTATVETLTAQVRVLMVGSRQVTLSMFKQLRVLDDMRVFEAMGFVSFHDKRYANQAGAIDQYWFVGANIHGELVRLFLPNPIEPKTEYDIPWWERELMHYETLPHIILAGLH